MALFGRKPAPQPAAASSSTSQDEQAVARYRYLLRTAPPEAIEQAHAEAFAQLTPEQRKLVLQQLADVTPAAERPVLERNSDDPQTLARAATRAEMRQPGVLERMFGSGRGVGVGAAQGFGSMMAGSLLGSVAGTVLGSMIAQEFFSHHHDAWLDPDAAGHHALASGNDWGLGPDGSNVDSADDLSTGPDIGGDFDGGSFDSGSFDV